MQEAQTHQTTRLELPPTESSVAPALAFVRSFSGARLMPTDRQEHLEQACRLALDMVFENNQTTGDRVGMDVFESGGNVTIEIINRGVPFFLNGHSASFHDIAQNLDKISIENRGREGQTVVLRMSLGEAAAQRSLEALGIPEALDPNAEVQLRDLHDGEETALSQLFFRVYGYNYIHEFVYYPEKIRQMRDEGKLISLVAAMPNGRLIGHVGLIKHGSTPSVYEPCLGVTDPAMKSRGLFGRLFHLTMDRVKQLPMHYALFDFVTNHEFSQKLVAKYNPVDLALFVGCQSKATQARLEKLGMGADPQETDRYTLLYSIIPQIRVPFGREVLLPNNLGEMLGFLLKPLNMSWRPAPRFELLPAEGDFQTHLQPAQNAVIFDLFRPGRAAVEKILRQWHQLLRNQYDYAAVEVPVDQVGIGNLYDLLAENGFFVAGFVPYHHSDRLALRFQAMGPTKISFDEIKVYTDTAKRLLQIIRQNYERNQLV